MSDEKHSEAVEAGNERPIEGIARELERQGFGPTPTEKGYLARCPVHKDQNRPNLSINEDEDGVVIMHCLACDANGQDVMQALDVPVQLMYPEDRRFWKGQRATIDQLSAKTQLPSEFLEGLGLRDIEEGVEIPYLDEDGRERFSRLRQYLSGKGAVRQPKGVRLAPYGLERISSEQPEVLILVEGESDSWTLWHHGFSALGLPGAAASKTLQSVDLRSIRTLYVVQENDQGGLGFVRKTTDLLAKVAPEADLNVVKLPRQVNDVNDLHCLGPSDFKKTFKNLLSRAGGAVAGEAEQRSQVLQLRTAADLYRENPGGVPWLVKGLVAEGALTVFVALYKAGKSTFLMDMVRAVTTGESFLNRETTRSKAVYLTEEAKATFSRTLERATLQNSHDVLAEYWYRVSHLSWDELIRQAADSALEQGARLLIVDTLHRFSGLAGEEENFAGTALELMKPLQEAKARGLGIVAVMHAGKGERKRGQKARGSTAFMGEADIILEMDRAQGNIRMITGSHSRFEEAHVDLRVGYADGRYFVLSEIGEFADERIKRDLIKATLGGDGKVRIRQLEETIEGVEPGRVRALVKELSQDQVLSCEKNPKAQGRPYECAPNRDHELVKEVEEEIAS